MGLTSPIEMQQNGIVKVEAGAFGLPGGQPCSRDGHMCWQHEMHLRDTGIFLSLIICVLPTNYTSASFTVCVGYKV